MQKYFPSEPTCPTCGGLGEIHKDPLRKRTIPQLKSKAEATDKVDIDKFIAIAERIVKLNKVGGE